MKSKAEYIKRRGTAIPENRSGAGKCMRRLLSHIFHLSFALALEKAILLGSDHFDVGYVSNEVDEMADALVKWRIKNGEEKNNSL